MNPTGELPPSMKELVDIIGLTAAMKLVDWRGGVGFHAPKEVPEDHELAKTVGLAAAKKLAKHYGGDWVRVPRCLALLIAERNRRIVEENRKGIGARKLALKYKLTDRQVWTVLSRAKAGGDDENGQGSLF